MEEGPDLTGSAVFFLGGGGLFPPKQSLCRVVALVKELENHNQDMIMIMIRTILIIKELSIMEESPDLTGSAGFRAY